MAVRQAMGAAEVPPIPARRVHPITVEEEGLLFWVRTGHSDVEVHAKIRRVFAGQAMWLPAGVRHSMTLAPDSLAFPIQVPIGNAPPAPEQVTVLTIPRGWEDWLTLQFARNLGYLRGAISGPHALLSHAPRTGADTNDIPGVEVPSLPMPRSRAAAGVARAILNEPGAATELTEYAAAVQIGVRQLQHQFRDETGMPFQEWRTRARIVAAMPLLRGGYAINWTRQQVGFATPAGFTRAFRRHTGRIPSDYAGARGARVTPRGNDEPPIAGQLSALTHPGRDVSAPPPIPALSTWERVNDFHIVVWVYRGTARVTIGDRTRRLRRGDAILLPAGVRNRIDIAEDSVLLPMSMRDGTSPAGIPDPRVVHFPVSAERWLLYTFVAIYSVVRPAVFDSEEFFRLVVGATVGHVCTRTTGGVPQHSPVHAVLAAVRNDPADPRDLTAWAQQLGVSRSRLRELFRAATGQTFPRWRGQVRMTVAREHLDNGVPPGEVGRRLGYAHASGFTRVFVDAHGMSPRAYERRRTRADRELD